MMLTFVESSLVGYVIPCFEFQDSPVILPRQNFVVMTELYLFRHIAGVYVGEVLSIVMGNES